MLVDNCGNILCLVHRSWPEGFACAGNDFSAFLASDKFCNLVHRDENRDFCNPALEKKLVHWNGIPMPHSHLISKASFLIACPLLSDRVYSMKKI